MTCIVGLVEKGKVYMGGDSAGVHGNSIESRKDTKIFKNRDFLIGYTSSFRMGQLLRFKLKPQGLKDKEDVYAYMCTNFVEAIRKVFKDGGYNKKEHDQDEGGDFLVGFKGRLFHIYCDYQVGEQNDNYDATGCGANLALGSLYTSNTMRNKTPNERLKMALEAAGKFNTGVSAPFNFQMV